MPTDVVSSIGTGGDYTTLQTWEDASPANLVTDDKRWIGELKQQEITGSGQLLFMSGITTDATRYIVLRCQSGAGFQDNASIRTTALAYSATYASVRSASNYAPVFRVDVNYTRLIGIQLKNTGFDMGLAVNGSNVLVDSCIVQAVNGNAVQVQGAADKLTNCLVLCGANGVATLTYGAVQELHGCTIIRTGTTGGTGISEAGTNPILKNSGIFNFTTVSSGSYDARSGYNATSGASAPGSNNQVSLTYADQFESTSSDWRPRSTGGLHAGTPDATNLPNDISATARHPSSPWIGAWEISGGGGSPLAPFLPAFAAGW